MEKLLKPQVDIIIYVFFRTDRKVLDELVIYLQDRVLK